MLRHQNRESPQRRQPRLSSPNERPSRQTQPQPNPDVMGPSPSSCWSLELASHVNINVFNVMLVRLSSPTSPGRRGQTKTIFWVANVPLLQRVEKGLFATVGLGLAHSRNLISEPFSHPAVSAACTSYGESSQYKFTWAIAGGPISVAAPSDSSDPH